MRYRSQFPVQLVALVSLATLCAPLLAASDATAPGGHRIETDNQVAGAQDALHDGGGTTTG